MKDREKPALSAFDIECIRRAQADVRAQGGELKVRVKIPKSKPMTEAPLFGQFNQKQKSIFDE